MPDSFRLTATNRITFAAEMKNYANQTFYITALVAAILLTVGIVSEEFQVGNLTIRKMDILKDIQVSSVDKPMEDTAPIDSTEYFLTDSFPADTSAVHDTVLRPITPHFVDTISQAGTPGFEDYSVDKNALRAFYDKISRTKQGKGKVRIAFYGDSFVEGDILLGDLRDTLQSLWGGNGVGFVPITSEVAQFKRTISHQFSGWEDFSIVKNGSAQIPYGINGHVYQPKGAVKIHLKGANYFHHTKQWQEARLYYRSETDASVIAGNPPQNVLLPNSQGAIAQKLFQGSSSEWWFENGKNAPSYCYGVSLEDSTGFYIDNFSVRGNTGGKLRFISRETIRQFTAMRPYDLVVVQLGLNAVTSSLRNIPWYEKELDQTIAHIQSCFPGVPILMVGVADRGGKVDGELATMPSVPAIVRMQRRLAQKFGLLFYDLYHKMGGPGTMIAFSHRHPALANTDYTHLTHAGGKVVGQIFATDFLEEEKRYRAIKNN